MTDEASAQPVAWITDWSYEHLVGGTTARHPVMMWPDPQDKTGLVPLYGAPQSTADTVRVPRTFLAEFVNVCEVCDINDDMEPDGYGWKELYQQAKAMKDTTP